ncbi:hypothetical protein DFP72DRAFT_890314 [Ephemerocybe angulata]|uniref:Beta-glucuronidase C-terminal domain-containing protein n=1 Tax=Ephemerocybe angulata TaxID=980116 RepID=A0A8H6M9A1_9AGAR|nr:hypothetical protein DFP72DRAFT_890314 [Tulosesus angulatus]
MHVPMRGLVLLACLSRALAQVTVYGQLPLGQVMANLSTTTPAAYNDTVLKDATAQGGLSVPHNGPSFYGFSIEMSVVTQLLGKNSTFIQTPFLNLMANIQERAGGVFVRIGGNTQEFATLVPEGDSRLQPGHTFGKVDSGSTQTTKTPAVLYTRDMFFMQNNISSLVNVKWFLGIPFNDSVNWRINIVEEGQPILGQNLLGLQAANEPDFYVSFGRRVAPYGVADYVREVGEVLQVLKSNSKVTNPNILLGPSTSLYAVTVEHYPHDNCAAMFSPGSGNDVDPQALMPYYLSHTNVVQLAGGLHDHAVVSPEFQTTYTSALWALDYGMQMATQNTTHALLHLGGQNVFYNASIAPPTNQTAFNQWTVGPIFYSAMVMAEAFGKTNTSQIVDLGANSNSDQTPAYAIYESGQLSKVALFNYVDDKSGASALTVALTLNGGVPNTVSVKCAASVSSKTNITWAGQTFGEKLTVDGRLRGNLDVVSIACNTGENTCRIPVPSPGFALVFFNSNDPLLTHNTLSIDWASVATSNGHNAGQLEKALGSTSPGAVKSLAVSERVSRVVSGLAGAAVAAWTFFL